MKTILLILIAALLIPSCATKPEDRRAQLTQWANVAISVAEVGGQINPKQAALIRKGGTLLLDLSEGKNLDIAALSAEAVSYAIETGALTPEQGALLKAAGTVPLTATAPLQGAPEPNPPVLVKP